MNEAKFTKMVNEAMWAISGSDEDYERFDVETNLYRNNEPLAFHVYDSKGGRTFKITCEEVPRLIARVRELDGGGK